MPWCPVIKGFMNQNCLYYNVLIIDSFVCFLLFSVSVLHLNVYLSTCLLLRWTAAQSSRLSSDCWMFARCVSVLRWSCKFPENNTEQIQVKIMKRIRTTRREKINHRREIFISFFILGFKQFFHSSYSAAKSDVNACWLTGMKRMHPSRVPVRADLTISCRHGLPAWCPFSKAVM